MVEISGQSYVVTIGSDVQRNGMYLEVEDAAKVILAEVFYHDGDHTMTFTSYYSDLPLPLIEWMIVHARDRLTPASDKGS